MKTVAIAGVGLIGGSFALALRQAGFKGRILGVSSPSTIKEALRLAVIDQGVTLEQACAEADLLYLAQPILTIIDVIAQIAPWIRPGMLVTDAGSTKSRIMETAVRHLPPGSFLGGHPMAGKEQRGVAAADAGLFTGRPYILTPVRPDDLNQPSMAQFVKWVGRTGAKPIVLDPTSHDRVVAHTSHVPQLLAIALAASLENVAQGPSIVGPGLIDMTRLALSPYDIWHDIILTNRIEISTSLQTIIDSLQDLQKLLISGDLRQSFALANTIATKVRENR